MSRLDPHNVVVSVRDKSDTVVRIGVSNWLELREIVRIPLRMAMRGGSGISRPRWARP